MKYAHTILLLLCSAAAAGAYNFKGVNLGGWLVLENFIVPSFFTDSRIPDEWTYCKINRVESPANVQKLRDHWANFIGEADWQLLSRTGINTVRLPIGYWAFATQSDLDAHQEPYLTGGQWPAVVSQLKFAKQYGVSIIIDLHGVPGSQNQFDNSGHAGAGILWGTTNTPSGDTMARTYVYLERLAQAVKATENDPTTAGAIVGIELINEALAAQLPGGVDQLKNYYLKGYQIVRQYLSARNYYVVIETGFLHTVWQGFMPYPQYQGVLLDIHLYQCFDAGLRAASFEGHLSLACDTYANGFINIQTLPTILGEWSVAYKVDSGNAAGEPYPTPNEINFLKQYSTAQQRTAVTNPSYGYFYWTIKTENHIAPMWDYQLGVAGGWMTNDDSEIQAGCSGYYTPGPKSVPLTYVVPATVSSTIYTPPAWGPSDGVVVVPATSDAPVSTYPPVDCKALYAGLTCRTITEDMTMGQLGGAMSWLCGNYPQFCADVNSGGKYATCNPAEKLSYATNLYYAQFQSQGPSACDFGGVVRLVASTSSSSTIGSTTSNSVTPATSNSGASTTCQAMFATLSCRTASENPDQVDAGKVDSATGWLCSTFPQYCTSVVNGGQYASCNSVEKLSYAMTQYYKDNGPDASACSFGGVGQVVTAKPATTTTSNSVTPATSNSGASTTCQAMFATLSCRTTSENPDQVDAGKVSSATSWLCSTFPQYCTSVVSGGQYANCNSVEKLSYAMTQYYKEKGPDASACSFGGVGNVYN